MITHAITSCATLTTYLPVYGVRKLNQIDITTWNFYICPKMEEWIASFLSLFEIKAYILPFQNLKFMRPPLKFFLRMTYKW